VSPPAKLTTDYFLVSFAQKLAGNYGRLDRSFVGGRVFFTVRDGAATEARTLLIDPERPRIFSGYLSSEVEADRLPFLHLKLTIQQLARFFTGKLDPTTPDDAGVSFEGNSEPFYQALGACL
jgi:hypothetical protein